MKAVSAPDTLRCRRPSESELRAFLEGARAFHREHGAVDVLAAVGGQRLIRVPLGRRGSAIAVLAVHVDELVAVDRDAAGHAE